MASPAHPSSLLKKEWIDTVRSSALAAENNGWLTDDVLAIIYQQKWFKALVPKAYGGLELSLTEIVALEEAFAWADGSLGWVITLCSGAGWFGGFLPPTFAEKIFANDKCCLAGSGAVTGTADKTEGGYIVNGQWQYASGSPAATVFTANCNVAGKTLSFCFLKEEVEILPVWNAMGMAATASHSFRVSNLFVPEERAFEIDATKAVINTPLYHYPFLQLAEATLVANISGMAHHFLDLCGILFNQKIYKGIPLAQHQNIAKIYDEVKTQFLTLREQLFTAVERSWNECAAGNRVSENSLKDVSTTAHALARSARDIVNKLYPYCGLSAVDKSSEINRCWRDIMTASQHSLLVFGR
jgi:alkylation response protein AidB-like acyl-CoA dehydrogenase